MSNLPEQSDLFANTLELPKRLMTELDSLKHILDGEKPELSDCFDPLDTVVGRESAPSSNSNHRLELNEEQLDLVELMVEDIVEEELRKLRPLIKTKVMVELKTKLNLD